jgi:hypothetical protein
MRASDRGYHREAIAGVRHVQIGGKNIKFFSGDVSQNVRYADGRNDLKTASFKAESHHVEHISIVVHQQHSVYGLFFDQRHATPRIYDLSHSKPLSFLATVQL